MALKTFCRIFCLSALLAIVSCSFSGKSSDIKSSVLKVSEKLKNWEALPPEASDYAFANPTTNSIITVNSLCGKYASTTLRHLTENLMGGVDDIETTKRETLDYVGREALWSEITGKTDGVPVYLVVQIVRKNECIYDFILISATEEIRKIDIADFKKLLSTVSIP
jgi:hypothetical protein